VNSRPLLVRPRSAQPLNAVALPSNLVTYSPKIPKSTAMSRHSWLNLSTTHLFVASVAVTDLPGHMSREDDGLVRMRLVDFDDVAFEFGWRFAQRLDDFVTSPLIFCRHNFHTHPVSVADTKIFRRKTELFK
jgi:hypothetical protein